MFPGRIFESLVLFLTALLNTPNPFSSALSELSQIEVQKLELKGVIMDFLIIRFDCLLLFSEFSG